MEQSFFQPHPLQIEAYYVKDLQCTVKGEFVDLIGQPAEPIAFPQLFASVSEGRSKDDPRRWRFEILIQSQDGGGEQFPYFLKIALIGFFNIPQEISIEQSDVIARLNGPTLLYSTAREILLSVTSRCGFPGIVLPTVIIRQPDALTPIEAPADAPGELEPRQAKSLRGSKKGSSKKGSVKISGKKKRG